MSPRGPAQPRAPQTPTSTRLACESVSHPVPLSEQPPVYSNKDETHEEEDGPDGAKNQGDEEACSGSRKGCPRDDEHRVEHRARNRYGYADPKVPTRPPNAEDDAICRGFARIGDHTYG